MVLFRDQGLIDEIVTLVSYMEEDKVLWAATYFGDSHYDGRYRHNFLTKDSGLPSVYQSGKGRGRQACVVLHGQRTGVLRRRELGGVHALAHFGEAGDDVRDAKGNVTEISVASGRADNYIWV